MACVAIAGVAHFVLCIQQYFFCFYFFTSFWLFFAFLKNRWRKLQTVYINIESSSHSRQRRKFLAASTYQCVHFCQWPPWHEAHGKKTSRHWLKVNNERLLPVVFPALIRENDNDGGIERTDRSRNVQWWTSKIGKYSVERQLIGINAKYGCCRHTSTLITNHIQLQQWQRYIGMQNNRACRVHVISPLSNS